MLDLSLSKPTTRRQALGQPASQVGGTCLLNLSSYPAYVSRQ